MVPDDAEKQPKDFKQVMTWQGLYFRAIALIGILERERKYDLKRSVWVLF